MTTPETKTVFKVRIVYKSGYTHDAEFVKLKINGGVWEWETFGEQNSPIIMGITEVAAVWQLSQREVTCE